MPYPRSCLVILGCYCITFQTVVDRGHERIHRTAESSEIVHINSPDHGTEIFLFLEEVHLVDDTISVLVANPLGALSFYRSRFASNSNYCKLILSRLKISWPDEHQRQIVLSDFTKKTNVQK